MGTSLNGLTPAATYQGLIKFGDNSIIGATLRYLSDGAGNDLPISVSTTKVGIGTTNSTSTLNVASNINLISATTSDMYLNYQSSGNIYYQYSGVTYWQQSVDNADNFRIYSGTKGLHIQRANGYSTFNNGSTTLNSTVGIKGSGSTSATTSLLVQNSSGTQMLQVRDDNRIYLGASGSWTVINGTYLDLYINAIICENSHTYMYGGSSFAIDMATRIGSQSAPVANAQLQVDSTTKGFLPPRMTTTQKNAIATPSAGLVVYDSTTNKLCCYNGSTWNDLF